VSPTLAILLVAGAVSASCAIVGTFLVLRRMALLGDAISHAVLPGIVIAFFLTGRRAPLPMVIGAGVLGVLTVFLVEMFHRSGRLKEDASIGVVFPALFSLGVILISRYAAQVDLDLDCVLYGEIAYAPWDLLFVGDASWGPKALWVNTGTLVANALLVGLFYKELKVTTFDPGLAAALGVSPVLIHYLLMSAVSVTVVGAFESVGAILVVAMLVVPPATAYLLTDRLGAMLALGVGFGLASAGGGYALARWWDVSIAGAMATVSGLIFAAALVGSPRYGVVAKLAARRRLGGRLAGQLLLLHLAETAAPAATLQQRFGWSERRLRRTTERLVRRGLVERRNGALALTAAGAAAVARGPGAQLAHPLAEASGELAPSGGLARAQEPADGSV